MTGTGISFGAFTILNGALCGIGSAVGVSLKTEAKFDSYGGSKDVTIVNDPKEDDRMARTCVRKTLEYIGEDEPETWSMITNSDIPISRGMKSSSSACNAIVSAVADEFDYHLEYDEIIQIGIDSARSSNVTVTGAYDDACACHFGGLFVTDNRKDAVMEETKFPDADVLFCVPSRKIRKNVSLIVDTDIRKKALVLSRTISKDPFETMTDNGRLLSSLLGLERHIEDSALVHGALAAGITGFGPAVAILLEKGRAKRFIAESGITADIITGTRGGRK